MVGRTAFFGVESALEPKEGETALVTGAAGAVGSIVVQLLKARGVRVIGTAGSDEKCELLKSLGADVAINYRTTKLDAKNTAALAAAAPDGIDVFFDNVGGDVFDCAIQLMNVHSRIAICGQISQYDDLDEPQMGPRFLHRLIYKRIRIQGILQRDATEDQRVAHQREFARMLEDGSLTAPVTVVDGFENIPSAQVSLFSGANKGKLMVRIAK
eukprot:TRINITY_DN88_c0_g3_i1.p2 TRINITY_DN88_c0_g3~~TRINITY_DN88_c0_g3_i1.p2  ORF type:complete len:213 (+),score=46.03 TRINITY_DN88_c0_g3_i1:433-1071(+)